MLFDYDILKIVSNNIKPETGRVLVAEPFLDDKYFRRSSVLLADEQEQSFMGFILNLKSDMFLHDFVDGFSKSNLHIYLGGPVQKDVLYYIHNFDFVEESTKIYDNLYLNGDIEQIKKLVNSGFANNKNIKFFLGNSGWSPGQLYDEIAFNSWLVSKIPMSFVFSNENNMWERAIDFLGEQYQIWKNFPVNPEFN